MRLDHIAAELRPAARDLDAGCVEGRDALAKVRVAAEIAKLGTTMTALYAQRCVETGVWASDRASRTPAVTPAEWLADVTDSGIGAARDALVVAEALPACGATDEALRSGALSLTAAREVTAAAAAGGEMAERRVLATAQREGLRGAKDESRRVLATAADAEARAAKIHRNRSRRRWVTREGIWNLHLQGPVALGAEIEVCLAPFDDAAWDRASKQQKERRDAPDAIAFDGLLGMARATRDGVLPTSGKARGRAKTRPHVVLHVDAPAIVSGKLVDGDRCEIAGVGPVPVAHARALLGDAILTILVEDGRDVRTFARPGRNVTAALAQLFEARDATCIITGCNRAARLEADHHRPVSEGGDSDDRNLNPLCRQHHRLKSKGWDLAEHPDGTWTLEPPASVEARTPTEPREAPNRQPDAA
jgi:hypothetical protein